MKLNIIHKAAAGFIFAAISMAGLASCTIYKSVENPRTVSVSGTGEVVLPCDTTTVTMAVRTADREILKATEANAQKMTDVQNAIVAAGIPQENISTANYTIHQQTMAEGTRNQYIQYTVENEISVKIPDVSKSGTIIDAAVHAGANELYSVEYATSTIDAAVKQARMLALKQAEETATTLASSCASTLGKALTISEYSSYSYPRSSLMSAAKAQFATEATTTPIGNSSTSVSVTVSVTYELQ